MYIITLIAPSLHKIYQLVITIIVLITDETFDIMLQAKIIKTFTICINLKNSNSESTIRNFTSFYCNILIIN